MVDTGNPLAYHGPVEMLKRCLTAEVLETVAEMFRARFSGSLVLRFHEGKVTTIETRTVRACDARRV